MLRHVIAPTAAYTKASHGLVRNRRMSSDAKILLLHLQGLPESAVAAKPLGEHAADLGLKPREYQRAKKCLQQFGHLHEWRYQVERGRWVTEQLISNLTLTGEQASAARSGRSPSVPDPAVGEPVPPVIGGPPKDEDGEKNNPHPPTAAPEFEPEPEPEGEPEGGPDPEAGSDPEVVRAERLLLSLRHEHRDLLLGVREARGLAGAAAEWLRRGVSPGDLRHALTAHLPRTGVRSAVGFLRHRLIEKLPAAHPVDAPFGEAPPPPPAPVTECAGPGDPHVFQPVGDETRCGPCRREEARRAHERAHPEARTDPLPGRRWRDFIDPALVARPDPAG
ncbi:hypothetical protein [Streptomyces termitum]|uniref:hypothetical protein n=1 Tax=Streptomyces termitum TaxID=67368 RepID=UPI0037971185